MLTMLKISGPHSARRMPRWFSGCCKYTTFGFVVKGNDSTGIHTAATYLPCILFLRGSLRAFFFFFFFVNMIFGLALLSFLCHGSWSKMVEVILHLKFWMSFFHLECVCWCVCLCVSASLWANVHVFSVCFAINNQQYES